MKKIIPSVLLVVISTCLTLAVVEAGAILVLKSVKQYARPFLYQSHSGLKGFIDHPKFQVLDPHLGYSRIPSTTVFGDPRSPGLKIAALGGSTTDPHIQPFNWSKQLHEMLDAQGIANVVYCAGAGGYSSHQELIKLIRDVLPQSPDLVISFTGVNDVGYAFSLPNHPMVHPYQFTLMNYLTNALYQEPSILPNTRIVLQKLAQRISPPKLKYDLGTVVESAASANWARNLKLMHAVAKEFNANYVAYLQPRLGVGKFAPSIRERHILTSEGGPGALGPTLDWYKQAGEKCRGLNYCGSLVDVFAGRNELWDDARHPNAEGYRLVAKAMLEDLNRRGWIKKPAPTLSMN